MTDAKASPIQFDHCRRSMHTPSWVIALLTAAIVTLLFVASSDSFQHWFVIPVFICGVLAGIDAVDWLRGRVQTFDPVGLMGIFTTFTLFFAPLLHVKWDVWMWEVVPPPDWRDWVGRMAAINIIGLLAYLGSREFFSRKVFSRVCHRDTKWIWLPDPQMFWLVGVLLLCATAALQAAVFAQFGGISGYINSFHEADDHPFDGMGWIFMISESFPLVLALMFIVYMTRKNKNHSWLFWVLFLVVFFGLRIIFGGLRGSRLATVLPLFWVTGAIHYMVRPIPKRLIAIGTLGVIAFMYAYISYKDGARPSEMFVAEERNRLQEIHHRSLEGMLLGDLGRTDVQAYVLYKLMSDPQQFKYAHGDTYLAAASLLIPRSVLPGRPPNKTVYGADLTYGLGSFEPDVIWSSRIYGIAGEAMINFSPFCVPFAYVLIGIFVARVRSFTQALQPGDLRLFFAPYLAYLCIWVYLADSDNVIVTLASNGLIPALFIVASARRLRRVHGTPPDLADWRRLYTQPA